MKIIALNPEEQINAVLNKVTKELDGSIVIKKGENHHHYLLVKDSDRYYFKSLFVYAKDTNKEYSSAHEAVFYEAMNNYEIYVLKDISELFYFLIEKDYAVLEKMSFVIADVLSEFSGCKNENTDTVKRIIKIKLEEHKSQFTIK